MITKEQLIERQKFVGSSDVATLLGFGYHGRTAADLFLEKAGRLEPELPSKEANRGTRLEPYILDEAESELGEKLTRNVRFVCKQLPILASNCDAIAPISEKVVEAKSSAVIEIWNDDYEPPESVIAQVHAQLLCTGFDIAFVPVLLPRLQFKFYEVQRNPDLCNVIMESVAAFEKCLKTDTPPEHAGYTIDVAKRIRRIAGKTGEVKASTVAGFKAVDAQLKMITKLHDAAKAALVADLGDNEAATYPGGKVTYYQQTQSRVDADELRTAYPEIAAKCMKTITFRKLGWK